MWLFGNLLWIMDFIFVQFWIQRMMYFQVPPRILNPDSVLSVSRGILRMSFPIPFFGNFRGIMLWVLCCPWNITNSPYWSSGARRHIIDYVLCQKDKMDKIKKFPESWLTKVLGLHEAVYQLFLHLPVVEHEHIAGQLGQAERGVLPPGSPAGPFLVAAQLLLRLLVPGLLAIGGAACAEPRLQAPVLPRPRPWGHLAGAGTLPLVTAYSILQPAQLGCLQRYVCHHGIVVFYLFKEFNY